MQVEPLAFIAMIQEDARKLQKSHGIFASVTIAQGCLETGYGKSQPVDKYTGKKSNNLFGVKGTGNNGFVVSSTWEVVNGKKITIDAKFRAYNSYYDSLVDHSQVLMLSRYAPVRNAKDGASAAMQLHPCGYATDPEYGTKLVSIMKKYNLAQYDVPLEKLYAVYQGKKHLGDFYDYTSAYVEAKKWGNSHVSKIKGGDWVWSNIPKQPEPVPEPVKEVKPLDAKTIEAAKKAIDVLHAEGRLNSPDYWKARIEESLPVWAYMIMEANSKK